MTYKLMFDVGGTKIKAGFISEACEVSKVYTFDAISKGTKEEIIENFASILVLLTNEIKDDKKLITGIGMAFPGPFDYENGISLMKNLGKYDSIYGCDIKNEIMEKLSIVAEIKYILKEIQFVFLHDIEAFAIGEAHFGAAIHYNKVICLCIGTGAGSAFLEGGVVLKQAKGTVPEHGWIYNTPFRKSIIDDYISVRGLERITQDYYNEKLDGYALYQKAKEHDNRAFEIFNEFGRLLLLGIEPFLEGFKPELLILGGQISKSFCFFGEELNAYCMAHGISIVSAKDTSISIWKGLLHAK